MAINVLYVEDNLADIELFKYHSTSKNSNFQFQIVEKLEEIKDSLKNSVDVVVSDFNLPGFDGIDVLRLVKEIDENIPVIFFSSSLGEERAVLLIREGATDFILKKNIEKLPLVIERAYHEKNNLKQNLQLQSKLIKQNDLLDTLFNNLTDMIYQLNNTGQIVHVNKSLTYFFNTTPENLIGKSESVLFKNQAFEKADEEVISRRTRVAFKQDYYNDEGNMFALEVIKTPLFSNDKSQGVVTVIRDITVEYQLEKDRQKDQNILKQAEYQTKSGSFEFDLENDVLHVSPNLMRLLDLKTCNSTISLKKLLSNVYPEDRKLFKELFESSIENQIDFKMEHRYITPAIKEDFRYCKTVIKAYPNKDEINFYGTIIDNTESRKASLAALEVQEIERAKISKELHDNVGQKLSAASMMLNSETKNIDKIQNLIDTSLNDIRFLSKTLNTPILNSETLEKNLHFLIENQPDPEKVNLSVNLNEEFISDFTKGQLYRIIQEGINNSFKYGEADNIDVKINEENHILQVLIKDNGLGFELNKIKLGNGINNMKARVNNCSGEFNLFSMPDHGTKISIKIPINNVKNTVGR